MVSMATKSLTGCRRLPIEVAAVPGEDAVPVAFWRRRTSGSGDVRIGQILVDAGDERDAMSHVRENETMGCLRMGLTRVRASLNYDLPNYPQELMDVYQP
jgi:hypothetical protein